MNKFKNVSKRLVVFLVLFSFLVGLLPLNFNTETVYAAKGKKNGTCYLFIVDSDASAKALSDIGVSDSSKAKILIYNAGKNYDSSAAGKNKDFKAALKKVKSVKQGAVIFFPSLLDVPPGAFTQAFNDKKHLTMNLLGNGSTSEHYGNNKAKNIKLFIDALSGLNKAKTKIIYNLPIPAVSGSSDACKAVVITNENSCFSKYFSTNKTKFSVESNPYSYYLNASTIVSSLKAKDKTTFKYLAYGTDVDEKGNMASGDSSGDSSEDADDNNVYTTSNDGKVKDKDHLFGDSGAPARYTMDGAEYYDVAVPYNTSIKHIGGYATSATTENKSYHYIGSTNDWANKQNGLFNVYNDGPGGLSYISSKYTNFAYDDNAGGLSYVMADGVKFYCAGIGQGLYANSAWGLKVNKNGEPNWDAVLSEVLNGKYPARAGMFFDLLLKDGTQIHFVACDFIGAVHSIGGADTKQDGITYTHSKLNCKQYLTMWHCDSPWHMVECSAKKGSSRDTIREKLGISKDNPVMYIRIWKASLNKDSGHITVASGMKDGTSKGSALSDAADGSNPDKKEVSDQYMKGYYDESELSAWTKIINESYIGYKSVTRNELNQSDLSSLSRWEKNVKYDDLENHGVFHIFRWLFMVMAILMMIWSVLLYCAYWMDKVNPFCLPFSFVSILTLGRLETAPTEEECNFTTRGLFKEKDTKSKFINHKYMLFVCISLIFFSVLILTGTLYKIILTVIGFVAGLFGF